MELEPEILLEITRATRESRENQKMTDDTTGDYKDSKKSLSVFDGERISYREWAIKFESFLSTKDCEEYIESYVDIPTKIEAKADEALEKEKREGTMEVFKGNKKALAYLVQYTTKHPLDMIYKNKSAYAAWKILEKKYDSKDTDGDLDSLFDKFSKCSLKSKKVDPDIWFTELDNISGKLKNVDPKYEKDSRQMIAHIKHNACDEYEEVIDNFKDIRAMDSTTMTQVEALKRLKKIVQGRWDSKFKPSENEQESEWDKGKLEGMNFNVLSGRGTFNGSCYNCGKKGHRSPECRSPKKTTTDGTSGSGRGPGGLKCWHCNGPHRKSDCPKLQEGAKTDTDTGDINGMFLGAVMEVGNEASYACIVKSVDETYVEWLGDTGAQMHVGNGSGAGKDSIPFYEKVTPKKLQGCFGDQEEVVEAGDTIVETRQGVKLQLNRLHYAPAVNRNILSINQLKDEGWKLLDTGPRSFSLIKNDDEIKFVQKEKNLYYAEAKYVEKTKSIHNITKDAKSSPAVVSDDDESDDEREDIPGLVPRSNADDDSDSDSDIDADEEEAGWTKVASKTTKKKLTKHCVNEAHDKWGHHSIRRCRVMAKVLGLKLIGDVEPCDACGLVKAKAKSVNKTTKEKATRPGERLFVDTTGPFPESLGKCKYWHGAVDDFSGKMFLSFSSSKTKMVDFVRIAFEHFKGRKQPVSYLRMDNAGEHEAIKRLCIEHGVKPEFIPPGTSQLNGRVERRFPVCWNTAKAMMQNSRLTDEFKRALWPEAVQTASFLGDMGPTDRSKVSAEVLYSGEPMKMKHSHFVEWGRVGIVTDKTKLKGKFKDKGKPMVMVGYCLDHPAGTYRMYNPKTRAVVVTDSVKWSSFKRWEAEEDTGMFKEIKAAASPGLDDNSDEEPDDPSMSNLKDRDSGNDSSDDEDRGDEDNVKKTDVEEGYTRRRFMGNEETQPRPSRSMSTRSMTKEHATGDKYKVTGDTTAIPIVLGADDNSATIEKQNEVGTETVHFLFNTCIASDPGEPKTLKEAMESPDREYWIASITAEINNFMSRGAWEFVKIDEVRKENRRPIPTKLVFKKKDEIDGTVRCKSRLVTLGFMQIPGVDYTEKFSPVATDASLKTLIAVTLFFQDDNWTICSLDVEAAFLEPLMDTPMYITIHDALVACGFVTAEEQKEYCIRLLNSMYGNCDAALRWIKMFVQHLTSEEVGMTQSLADPCVLYKRNDDGSPQLIVTLTVDDCAIAGKQEHIDWFMDMVAARFKITRGGRLKKHLGVDYVWKKDEKGETTVEATMDAKANNIVDDYEAYIGREVKICESPGFPHQTLEKYEGDPVDIDKYRSLVGKLMFFTTKLCLKTANASRALACHMSGPGPDQWKAMGRAVGYVKGMALKGLTYRRPESLRVICLVDTDFANCPDTRRSVGCTVTTIGGTQTEGDSARHDGVSQSSTEAEYRQLAKGASSVQFHQMLLEEIAHTEYPAIILEDNNGAIFLAKNKQVGKRTKHIDVKFHFVREFTTEGRDGLKRAEIVRVESEENTADIGTKNTDLKTFKFHADEIDAGMPNLRRKIFGNNGVVQRIGGMLRHGNGAPYLEMESLRGTVRNQKEEVRTDTRG